MAALSDKQCPLAVPVGKKIFIKPAPKINSQSAAIWSILVWDMKHSHSSCR